MLLLRLGFTYSTAADKLRFLLSSQCLRVFNWGFLLFFGCIYLECAEICWFIFLKSRGRPAEITETRSKWPARNLARTLHNSLTEVNKILLFENDIKSWGQRQSYNSHLSPGSGQINLAKFTWPKMQKNLRNCRKIWITFYSTWH